MKSRRCGICSINWPKTDRFKFCPQCEEPTSPMYEADPISDEEANRLANIADFEAQYGPMEVEA